MRTVNLGEVVQINPRLPKEISTNKKRPISFLPMAGVTEGGKIVTTEERHLGEVAKGYRYFEKGDILLAKITPCFENGKATIVDDSVEHQVGFGSTEFHVLRPTDQIHSRYLFYLIWNPAFRFAGEKNMTGTAGQKRVPVDFLKRFKIPLPPLPEQKRIAAILDKADAIRRKRQQAIKFADDFLRATFLDMFGDPVTNPKGWEVKPIGEMLSFLTSGSRGWAKYYSSDGALFLRIQNIGANELILDDVAFVNPPESAEARRTRVQAGDVLMSITADLGRTAVIPDSFPVAHINQHLAILRFEGVDPLYASAFLASSGGQVQINKLNREGVKAGLNFDNVRSLKMMIPPEPLQKKWRSIYAKKTQHSKTLNDAGEWDNQLFNSLTQRAFREDL